LDGVGILVLSHTNNAVDLIKEKIGTHCGRLFQSPNFIGTIQSFVNTFLAAPYFENKYKVRPSSIEADFFNQRFTQWFQAFISPANFNNQERNRLRRIIAANGKLLNDFRLDFGPNNQIIVTDGLGGNELSFNKPGPRNKNWVDYTAQEKLRIKEWLIEFRKLFWQKTKLIHYDDAYFFAQAYIKRCPPIKNILRRRFKLVFVDEMQDMDVHQVKLLDEIFFSNVANNCIQRIGDKNQAIFSYDVKLDDVWQIRNALTLNRSLRLSNLIAQKVQPLGLIPTGIVGDNQSSNVLPIPPRIIVYGDNSIDNVVRHFAMCIESLQISGHIPHLPKHKFKAIGWRKYAEDQNRTTLYKYYPSYHTPQLRAKPVLTCLSDYFSACCCSNITSRDIVSSIFDSMLRVLAFQNLQKEGREFTKSSLRSFLQRKHEVFYFDKFLPAIHSIYNLLLQRNIPQAKTMFQNLIVAVISLVSGAEHDLTPESIRFLQQEGSEIIGIQDMIADNMFIHNTVKVEIGTVHGAKGETHCSTLFLETFFYGSHESQRLIHQLLGIQVNTAAGVRVKQSARIAYVAFSRPTHFLCVAIHNDRLIGHKEHLRAAGWDVDETLIL
jgi:DNA helicase II / ATP-dependent DNA helicase PcrA